MNKIYKSIWKLAVYTGVLFLLTSSYAFALDVTLQWDENISSDNVTGYVICYEPYINSTPPANDYAVETDVLLANITGVGTGIVQYTISGLDKGNYWFSVRAYRIESGVTLRSGHAEPVTNKGTAMGAILLLLLNDD